MGTCSSYYFPIGRASIYCKCGKSCYCSTCGKSGLGAEPLLPDQEEATRELYVPLKTVKTGYESPEYKDFPQESDPHSIYMKPFIPKKQSVHWGYDESNGPNCWSDISHKNILALKGKQQSPINIVSMIGSPETRQTISESQNIRITYPEFFKYCTIVNNGHTVQVNIANEESNDSKEDEDVHTGCLFLYNKKYVLKQFHFHTPSEHMIDATPFDLEMHLVHVCAEDNSIAVLGFLFDSSNKAIPKLRKMLSKIREEKYDHNNELGDEDDDIDYTYDGGSGTDKDSVGGFTDVTANFFSADVVESGNSQSSVQSLDMLPIPGYENEPKRNQVTFNKEKEHHNHGNEFFEQFWDELPLVVNVKHPIKLSQPLSMDFLFETSAKKFRKRDAHTLDVEMDIFHYEGSLTTPPCTEGVKWLVAKVPQWASIQQIHKLKGCWNYMSNARPVQNYNGRVVTMSSTLTIHHL